MDVTDIAISGYEVFIIKNGHIHKSTNCGSTWAEVPMPSAFAYPALNVAVAPDDLNIIAVTDSRVAGDKVWLSTDGGLTWADFGKPKCGVNAVITDIAVSAIANGQRSYFVTVADNRLGNTNKGDVMVKTTSPAGVVQWTGISGYAGVHDYMAIQASPNFTTDLCICFVGVKTSGELKYVFYPMNTPSQSQTITLIPAGTALDYGSGNNNHIAKCEIALPEDFIGSDEGLRRAFVSVAARAFMHANGVYRIDGTPSFTYFSFASAILPAVGIWSIDIKNSLLVIGEYDSNIVRYSHTPFKSAINWQTATTMPEGQYCTVVKIGVQCQKIFAGTRGNNSGISRSTNSNPQVFTFLFGC